jgi:hypothetical protein
MYKIATKYLVAMMATSIGYPTRTPAVFEDSIPTSEIHSDT